MADHDPNLDRQDPNVEVPGDTNSADIVDRTGEQMPQQSHDGVVDDTRDRSAESAKAGHDNPRTGRISDW
jgi:hypothetical protein